MASVNDVTPMLEDSDLASEGQSDDSEIPKSNNPTALPKRGRAAIGSDKAKVTTNNSMAREASFRATVAMNGGNPSAESQELCSSDTLSLSPSTPAQRTA